VAVEAKMRLGDSRNTGTSTIVVKPPNFDGSMSWTVFHCQFDAMADHNDWVTHEKSTIYKEIMEEQAADIAGHWDHATLRKE
jgi:hypothetical protein